MSNEPPIAITSKKTHSRAHVNVLRVIIIALLAAGLLAYFGAFKANPKIALVTSSDTPYWDLVIRGANEAANMDAEAFASGEAFLASLDKFRPDCVVRNGRQILRTPYRGHRRGLGGAGRR